MGETEKERERETDIRSNAILPVTISQKKLVDWTVISSCYSRHYLSQSFQDAMNQLPRALGFFYPFGICSEEITIHMRSYDIPKKSNTCILLLNTLMQCRMQLLSLIVRCNQMWHLFLPFVLTWQCCHCCNTLWRLPEHDGDKQKHSTWVLNCAFGNITLTSVLTKI